MVVCRWASSTCHKESLGRPWWMVVRVRPRAYIVGWTPRGSSSLPSWKVLCWTVILRCRSSREAGRVWGGRLYSTRFWVGSWVDGRALGRDTPGSQGSVIALVVNRHPRLHRSRPLGFLLGFLVITAPTSNYILDITYLPLLCCVHRDNLLRMALVFYIHAPRTLSFLSGRLNPSPGWEGQTA
jgi:hypothetical protein